MFSAPAFLIFLNRRMRLSSVVTPIYLFPCLSSIPMTFSPVNLFSYPGQICGIPWLPFFHLVHPSSLFILSYFPSHPTGSVSVGVWQMACRRVVVVIEKVVKDFVGTSLLFFRDIRYHRDPTSNPVHLSPPGSSLSSNESESSENPVSGMAAPTPFNTPKKEMDKKES